MSIPDAPEPEDRLQVRFAFRCGNARRLWGVDTATPHTESAGRDVILPQSARSEAGKL